MGQIGTPIVAHDYHGRRHAVYVRCTRSAPEVGGYDVRRRDNDRLLGRVYRSDGSWHFTVNRGAFRGAGIDDTGHVKDVVPATLFGPMLSPCKLHTRENAVFSLVTFLIGHRAPAVGFGCHPDVRAHVEGVR